MHDNVAREADMGRTAIVAGAGLGVRPAGPNPGASAARPHQPRVQCQGRQVGE
ncbi:hypothetical protein GCM10027059_42060 [Myceligenerans halotolerans]